MTDKISVALSLHSTMALVLQTPPLRALGITASLARHRLSTLLPASAVMESLTATSTLRYKHGLWGHTTAIFV